MSKFIFKINPEHCPANAFDQREVGLWEAGVFTVPWPRTLDGRRLDLAEIKRGDECWIWLHVERRKDKDRRSPGLVGQAVIEAVAAAEDKLLSVHFSKVSFRNTALLREQFEKHQDHSITVQNVLGYTTRRVAALTEEEAADFERVVNLIEDQKRRLLEQFNATLASSHSDPSGKTRKDYAAEEDRQSGEHWEAEEDHTANAEYEAGNSAEVEIENRTDIGPTEKERLVKARRGQGIFKRNVKKLESVCRVTGIDDVRHLRASHIKPWRSSSDFEKLDGNNGLLLSPHIDHLFDQGYISFSDSGELLVSQSMTQEVLDLWGVAVSQACGEIQEAQRVYLAYHRDHVFRLN